MDGVTMSIRRTALRALTTALIVMSGACVAPPPSANPNASASPRGSIGDTVKTNQGMVQGAIADGVAVFKG
jgi:hypothetical protein